MKSPFSFCIVERGCLSLFALVFFHGIYMLFGSFERADFIECLSESSRKRTPRVRRGGSEGYGLYAECVEVGAKEFQGVCRSNGYCRRNTNLWYKKGN